MGEVEDTGDRPDEDVARNIAREFCGRTPEQVRRFAMGIGHWVYELHGADDEKLVVRVGSPDQAEDFLGAVHWSRTLRPLGVPLPSLLAAGSYEKFPYVILERLPGEDLGQVYASLEAAQKRTIAAEVFRIQSLLASLGDDQGFGYMRLPGSPRLSSWRQVIDDSIHRSQSRMALARSQASRAVEQVRQSATRFEDYFARVRPTPFLDDTTTKNVLVHRGALSGIVDVDWICFGDPLLTVALTRASLLGSGQDLAYTDYWLELFEPSSEQRAALRFYTALCFLDFMSELGHRFNRDAPTVGAEDVERLETLLREQLSGL